MSKFHLYFLSICYISFTSTAQIKSEGITQFTTNPYFNVVVDCEAYYKIFLDRIFVRIQEGEVKKSNKYNQEQVLSRIYVSLSEVTANGGWRRVSDSIPIELHDYVLNDSNPLDISYIPEIQSYEFTIPLAVEPTLYRTGLTITIEDPRGHLRHAHAPFLKRN